MSTIPGLTTLCLAAVRLALPNQVTVCRGVELVERLLEKNLGKDFFVALSAGGSSPDLVAHLAGRAGWNPQHRGPIENLIRTR